MTLITRAIIFQGIVKGIPEGEKIPEKQDFIEKWPAGQRFNADAYNRALSSLGTEFEDIEEIADKLPSAAFEPKPDKPRKFKLKDGIYPISVEVDEVYQRKHKEGYWGPDPSSWFDIPEYTFTAPSSPLHDAYDYRQVLRIVEKKEHYTNHSCPSDIEAEKKMLVGESARNLIDLLSLKISGYSDEELLKKFTITRKP